MKLSELKPDEVTRLSDLKPEDIQVVEPKKSGLKLSELNSEDVTPISQQIKEGLTKGISVTPDFILNALPGMLGKAAVAAKNLKLVPEATEEEKSYPRTALLHGGQGATFGLADEASAGLAALTSLLDPDNKSSMSDVYKGVRDITREETKQAEEQNPNTALLSSLLGGVGTGVGLAGRGIGTTVGQLAKGAQGPAMKLGSGAISQAARFGSKAGALSGLGTSEGDLTTIEGISQTNDDIASGALLGALTGGGITSATSGAKAALSGVKKIGSEIKDTQLLDDIIKSFKFGKKGIKLSGKSGRDEIAKETSEYSAELVNTLEKLRKKLGTKKGAVLKASENKQVDIATTLDDALEQAKGLPENTKVEINDKNELIEFLSKKRNELNINLEVPSGVETIPGAPSGRTNLQKKIDKILEGERVTFGPNKPFNIIESPDKKLITATRALDEQIGATERVVRTAGEILPEEQPFTKVKRSFPNSPKDKAKAQEAVAKLNAKAKIEGKTNTYELIDDLQNGFYHVIEKGKKPVNIQGESELALLPRNNAENYKSNVQKVGPVPNVPEVPTTTQELPLQNVTLGTQPISPTEVDLFRRSAQGLTQVGDESLATPKARAQATDLSKRLGDILSGNVEEGIQPAVPGLADVNKQYSSVSKALNELNILDEMGNKTKLDKERAISSMLERTGNETLTGDRARRLLNEVLGHVKGADEKLASEIGPKALELGEKLDLARKVGKEGMGKIGVLGSLKAQAIGGSNIAGRITGSGIKSIKDITAQSPERLKSIGNAMLSGTAKSAELGKKFIEVSNKDNYARNALMFQLEQDPVYRKELKDFFGFEDDK